MSYEMMSEDNKAICQLITRWSKSSTVKNKSIRVYF